MNKLEIEKCPFFLVGISAFRGDHYRFQHNDANPRPSVDEALRGANTLWPFEEVKIRRYVLGYLYALEKSGAFPKG